MSNNTLESDIRLHGASKALFLTVSAGKIYKSNNVLAGRCLSVNT